MNTLGIGRGRVSSFRGWAASLALASLTLQGPLSGAPARAEAPQVLSWISADADGDGKPDTLTLRGDGTLQIEWAGRAASTLRFGPAVVLRRPADLQFLVTASGRYVLARASEVGRGGATQPKALAAQVRGGGAVIASLGAVGPVGRDGEYAVDLSLSPAGLLRYQTTPSVRRCDGENRLFVERYADAGFQADGGVTLPASGAGASEPTLLTATSSPPSAYAGPAMGIYRWIAASAAAHATRADQLGPPRELEDDSPLSAWAPPATQVPGAFVTAQADGSGHAPRAIRIAAAKGRPLPSRLLIILGAQKRFQVSLGSAAVQWVTLPADAGSDCVSLVIVEGAGDAAIGDAAIYSELDGPDGLAAIADQVASSEGSQGEGAVRTLLLRARRDANGRTQVLAAVATALGKTSTGKGEGLRRLDDLLLQLAESDASASMPPGNAPPTAGPLDALLAQVVARRLGGPAGASPADELPLAFLRSLAGYPRVGSRLLRQIHEDAQVRAELRGQALLHWVTLQRERDPQGTASYVLSHLPDASAKPGLAMAWPTALAAALSCASASEGSLNAALTAVDSQRTALRPTPGAAVDSAALARLSLLLTGLSQAFARCPDSPQTATVADRIAALWPGDPEDAGTALPTPEFTLRYRVLQALDRLAHSSPAVHAVIDRAGTTRSDPVLRQLASRLRVRLASPAPNAASERLAGLRDPDAGVRLATLSALSAGDGPQRANRPALSATDLAQLDAALLSDSWPGVRRAAAEARGGQCRDAGTGAPPTKIDPLRTALADRDVELQRRALAAIARCEGAAAIDVFIQVAENAEAKAGLRGQSCALLARHALAASTLPVDRRAAAHRAAGVALVDMLRDPQADDRHAAALSQCLRGFAEAGDASDLPALLEATAGELPATLRQLALGAIGSVCARRSPGTTGRPEPLPSKIARSLRDVVAAALAPDQDARMQATARRVQAQCQ